VETEETKNNTIPFVSKLENTIFNSMSDLLVYQDLDHKIIFANKSAAQSIGKKQEELIGKYCYEIWHNRKEPCINCPVQRAIENNGEESGVITTPDGRYWFIKGYPTKDIDGNLIGALEITKNITLEKELKEELENIETLYATAFSAAGIGIAICNNNGNIKKATPKAADYLGLQQHEIINKNIFSILFKDNNDEIKKIKTTLYEKSYEVLIKEFTREKSNIHYIEIKFFSYKSKKKSEILILFDDITEKYLLDKQIFHIQKMESLARLTSGIAHDFNNFLNIISGYTDLILFENNIDQKTLITYLEAIKSTIHRAAKLIRQLLTFSKHEETKGSIIELNTAIKNSESLLTKLLGKKIIYKTILSSQPLNIKIDETQLTQILLNFASNSKDAMPNGGEFCISTDRVDLTNKYYVDDIAIKPGYYVLLSVSDTGTGIDKDTISHIFEPFFTTKPEDIGTGIGLATVYRILKQNNAYITVKSKPGEGTTFRIFFPETVK